jgi:hypothetical protein
VVKPSLPRQSGAISPRFHAIGARIDSGVSNERTGCASLAAVYAESACTTRGCHDAGAMVEYSRGKRGDERCPPDVVPNAFRSAATWLGSSCTLLCVNQPIPLLNDCCRNSIRLP